MGLTTTEKIIEAIQKQFHNDQSTDHGREPKMGVYNTYTSTGEHRVSCEDNQATKLSTERLMTDMRADQEKRV